VGCNYQYKVYHEDNRVPLETNQTAK